MGEEDEHDTLMPERIFIINFVTLKLQNHLLPLKCINAWKCKCQRKLPQVSKNALFMVMFQSQDGYKDSIRHEAFLASANEWYFHLLIRKLEGRMMEYNHIVATQ